MRSLYSGVSGLQNHQYRTDVIGNNISNINTNGFKKNRVNFQDMLYQTLEGSSRPNESRGGVNPKQVGLGMKISSIDTLMSQGSLQTTGKKTDLSIQGEGFFILKGGNKIFYTRAGNYALDADQNLVNPSSGLKLQGWNSVKDDLGNSYINTSDSYTDIHIPMGEKDEAKETVQVVYKSNLDSRLDKVQDPNNISDEDKKSGKIHLSSIDIYDKQGKLHKLELKFVKVAMNQWEVQVDIPTAVGNSVIVDVGQLGNVKKDSLNKNKAIIEFNDNGSLKNLSEMSGDNSDSVSEGDLSLNITFNVDNGILSGDTLGYQKSIEVKIGSIGAYNGITQFASNTTTKAISQDGYGLGYLDSFDIDQNGIVTGIYSNGQRREISQVAMATFVNPGGLEKAGDTNYVSTSNSGMEMIGSPNSQGKGSVIPGTLEMSNVDLSEEFTNMIVAQRGFQANSRIITTSDQMLQELLTLKRS